MSAVSPPDSMPAPKGRVCTFYRNSWFPLVSRCKPYFHPVPVCSVPRRRFPLTHQRWWAVKYRDLTGAPAYFSWHLAFFQINLVRDSCCFAHNGLHSALLAPSALFNCAGLAVILSQSGLEYDFCIKKSCPNPKCWDRSHSPAVPPGLIHNVSAHRILSYAWFGNEVSSPSRLLSSTRPPKPIPPSCSCRFPPITALCNERILTNHRKYLLFFNGFCFPL